MKCWLGLLKMINYNGFTNYSRKSRPFVAVSCNNNNNRLNSRFSILHKQPYG